MAQASQFVISEFTNPSGEIVFRVTGWLDGKRIRKNFPTRADAVAERQTLDIQRVQSETGVRTAATHLTDEQLHEAEAAFRRLADAPKSLSFYLDYALANYRAPEREITVAAAVETYLATKKKEQANGMLSECQLKDIRVRLDCLVESFPRASLSQLSRETLAAHCQRGNPKLKTFNNRRGILFTFFKFAFCQDWVAANPLEKVPHLRIAHRRGSAKTLSAEQRAKLMHHVEQIEALATDTGRMPNRLVIGLPLKNKLRNNAKVIARFPGAASVGVSMAQFSSLLLNPSIDIRVGILAKDTAKLGAAKANVNIIGQQLVIFHANASPTLYDPSFMKTFRLRRGGVDVVRTYREDAARSDILAVDWSEDIRSNHILKLGHALRDRGP
jgi:hypothetical protein